MLNSITPVHNQNCKEHPLKYLIGWPLCFPLFFCNQLSFLFLYPTIRLTKLHFANCINLTTHLLPTTALAQMCKAKKLKIFLFDFFKSKVDKSKTFFVCTTITKSCQRLYMTVCTTIYQVYVWV